MAPALGNSSRVVYENAWMTVTETHSCGRTAYAGPNLPAGPGGRTRLSRHTPC